MKQTFKPINDIIMNKKTTIISSVSLFAFLITGLTANAQFTETMGTTGPSTETVNAREAAGRFAVASLTYSGVNSDARTTTPSHTGTGGYAGASAGYNVLLQPGGETFEIRTIDASACSGGTLSFGVNKNLNASNGSELVLEYSVNGGAAWTPISWTALPTGTGTSGTTWYLRSVTLPAGAISSTLWLRWTNTQAGGPSTNPQFRIDDVTMSCGATVDCSSFTGSIAPAAGAPLTFCAGTATTTLESATNIGTPSYQWYYLNDATPIVGATFADLTDIEASGTYYVKISNGSGCTVTSNAVRVLVYPAPQLCDATVEGCAGDTVEFCPELRTEDLIISQYMEGSGLNKCIELYNGTCEPRNSGDYELRMYVNGSASYTLVPTTPNYVILPGQTYVICNDLADSAHLANKVTSLLSFNGNDAIELFNTTGGVTADIFGVPGFNPGSSWRDTVNGSPTENYSTENLTLVRKPCVYSGITVNPSVAGIYGFATLFTEWDTLPQNATAGFGSHVFTGAPYTFAGSGVVAGSATSTCVDVIIGRDPSVLEVTPSLCAFNNCVPVNVAVVDTCGAGARSMSAPVQGSLKLQAFPNPTVDATTIVFNQEKDGEVAITVTDLSGHVVFAQTVLANEGQQRIELNMSQLAAGTYVCSIATGNGYETVRIVKSK
jgi:hypothetical protein